MPCLVTEGYLHHRWTLRYQAEVLASKVHFIMCWTKVEGVKLSISCIVKLGNTCVVVWWNLVHVFFIGFLFCFFFFFFPLLLFEFTPFTFTPLHFHPLHFHPPSLSPPFTLSSLPFTLSSLQIRDTQPALDILTSNHILETDRLQNEVWLF